MKPDEIQSAAAALYDGGWRSTDKLELIAEHDMDEEYAEQICQQFELYGEAKKLKYRGIVRDRMQELADKKSFWYETYKEAHDAAETLCRATYSGDRGEIDVTTEVE